MTAYYNECDPYAAQWLRNLIAAGLIAPGDVDDRKIEEVRPDDLRGFTQCHFFAGIGGWSAALRLAEWPDDKPVWTGSCPCQPFSAAGKQDGIADPRHLWPVWNNLITECRPAIVFGEQVANAVGHGWIDTVQGDLETQGYACGYMVLGAHSVGAPHIRQRLWFVGLANGEQSASQQRYGFDLLRGRADTAKQIGMGGGTSRMANGDGAGQPTDSRTIRTQRGYDFGGRSAAVGMENTKLPTRSRLRDHGWKGLCLKKTVRSARAIVAGGLGCPGDSTWVLSGGRHYPLKAVGDTSITRWQGPGRLDQQCDPQGWQTTDRQADLSGMAEQLENPRSVRRGPGRNDHGQNVRRQSDAAIPAAGFDTAGTLHSFWRDADWLYCRDGCWRPVEPGTFPLAYGVPARVGRLRAYGNAIVPQVAATFIRAVMEAMP